MISTSSTSSKKIRSKEKWDLVLRPQRGWWDLRLGELWRYRDLISLFVWRDFVAYYKQTILGPLWYIIQPILSTVVFTVIFGNIARLPTDGLPAFLFYLSGNTIWSYFSTCLINTSNTFTTHAGIFGKVYFPRLVVPLSIVISNLISFAIRMIVFLAFLLYFIASGSAVQLTLWALALPALILIMAGMGLGLG
ncbi:MAG: ABC transporter permease, partial [Bacteroidales bacterium]|nr:ABC transporter permease [Bacteroidales bacterium]